ncbi:hypothetical protein [Aggregatibacter kilianii]|uniref:hypothetical protein n=1 Tax=Aggregatibacter kilianii TaxID=2025884 RepID=UPI000D64A642|nr:hypothetical protein [Aggregatibacter kilianii]DAK67464.1 MAG TPA: hypothetical protein [Caudoviricetes sp.]
MDQLNTQGEKLIGKSRKQGNSLDADGMKQVFITLIDALELCREDSAEHGTLNSNKEALIDQAQMKLVEASMWVTKAVTYGR